MRLRKFKAVMEALEMCFDGDYTFEYIQRFLEINSIKLSYGQVAMHYREHVKRQNQKVVDMHT